MIKLQQSQALTSHFESFWSIVHLSILSFEIISVMLYGQFTYKGLHCQIMELLECNIRSVIFKNERQGLSPWATQKFARDVLM